MCVGAVMLYVTVIITFMHGGCLIHVYPMCIVCGQ